MIESWVGLECTVNRVGDRYLDQVERCGHAGRVQDIDSIAALGVGRLRYPVLWERVAPLGLHRARWSRVDAHLSRMHMLGLAPIAGLVHHGSGPADTSLLDPQFPERLAEYAHAVAERYPWIDAWTPVNEPLVTARFSGLYGHWYPHRRDDDAFVRMVLTQSRAIVLAMQAVRRVNRDAKYVHTDDGGTVFSTPALAYQAEFENHRRDLVLDLLFGRVDTHHPLHAYLTRHGATGRELQWFAAQDVRPDVIGIDYYATSDRYLDEQCERHDASIIGGNGIHRYADVAACHGMAGWQLGFEHTLRRTFASYGTPVALTEVHLGCTREEQLRWLHAAWTAARAAEQAGIPVKAVTAWALLGAFDWDQLATVDRGHYEPGIFDVRATPPRLTAIGQAVYSLATDGTMHHPVLQQPGWWERAEPQPVAPRSRRRHQRLLILGSRGTLGSAFVRHCQQRGLDFLALSRAEVDVRDPMQVRRAVAACRPWAVVNATGFVDVDGAEQHADDCMRINAQGAEYVADACARSRARLLSISSDLVFDGAQNAPYLEDHHTGPLNVYGRSKVAAEQAVRAQLAEALVVRTSAFFGPWDEANFVTGVLRQLSHGLPVLASRCVVTPTWVPALVDTSLDLLVDGASGLWHLANSGPRAWSDLARTVATMVGHDPSLVTECESHTLGWTAARPTYSGLGSRYGNLMPSVEESLERYFHLRRISDAEAKRAAPSHVQDS